jgi:hypothetical protein
MRRIFLFQFVNFSLKLQLIPLLRGYILLLIHFFILWKEVYRQCLIQVINLLPRPRSHRALPPLLLLINLFNHLLLLCLLRA